MVREIKFIGWDGKHMMGPFRVGSAMSMIPFETLRQYTGQEDYNEKEIYDGDIVKGKDELAVIEWNEDMWSARLLKNKKGFDDWMPPTHMKGWRFGNLSEFISYAKHEVISNRYENPELFND